jgi:hypothetical protein
MILTRSGQTLPFGQDVTFEIEGETYIISYASLIASSDARARAGVEIGEPPMPSLDDVKAAECERINAESARHGAMDFAFDFEGSPGVTATGQPITAAGVRHLQMREENLKDWQGQQSRALAAVLAGQPNTVIKVIVSDNATIFAPAEQFLQCFEAGCQRREANAVWRVTRKALVKAQTTIEGVEGTKAATDAGWPQ